MTAQAKISSRTWPGLFLKDFARTGTALWFFLYILTRMNPRTGCFRTRFKRVAEEIGVSTVKLRGWLEQLEQEGYLKDESWDGKMIVRIAL